MFDIGFWELALISVVGLVVLGPERLPVAIRQISRFIHSAKSMATSVKDELSQELKIKELQDNLRKAEQLNMGDLSPELKASVEELKQAARDVQRPYSESNQHIQNQSEEPEQDPTASDDDEALSDLETLNIKAEDLEVLDIKAESDKPVSEPTIKP